MANCIEEVAIVSHLTLHREIIVLDDGTSNEMAALVTVPSSSCVSEVTAVATLAYRGEISRVHQGAIEHEVLDLVATTLDVLKEEQNTKVSMLVRKDVVEIIIRIWQVSTLVTKDSIVVLKDQILGGVVLSVTPDMAKVFVDVSTLFGELILLAIEHSTLGDMSAARNVKHGKVPSVVVLVSLAPYGVVQNNSDSSVLVMYVSLTYLKVIWVIRMACSLDVVGVAGEGGSEIVARAEGDVQPFTQIIKET